MNLLQKCMHSECEWFKSEMCTDTPVIFTSANVLLKRGACVPCCSKKKAWKNLQRLDFGLLVLVSTEFRCKDGEFLG